MGERWPDVFLGSDLSAPDGYKLTKYRMSLGRSPATFQYEGTGRYRVVIIAEAYAAYGLFPILSLSQDGREVRKFYMNVPGEHIYSTVVTLAPGKHTFSLLFENDYVSEYESEDRNVFIREVRLGRE